MPSCQPGSWAFFVHFLEITMSITNEFIPSSNHRNRHEDEAPYARPL
jgi:hypothetical protein